MKLKYIDIDKFCEDLPEITSYKITENSKISKNGIFSQQIFGPIISYKCACNKNTQKSALSDENKCLACDVEYISSDVRSKRYGKIKLPFPVLNPLVYIILNKARPSSKKIIDNMLYYKSKYYIEGDEIKKLNVLTDLNKDLKILEGLSGVLEYVNLLIDGSNKKELTFLKNHKDILTINNIVVIPPALRNFTKNTNNTFSMDSLNRYYNEIIMRVYHFNNIPFNVTEDQDIYKMYFRLVQEYTIDILNYIIDKLSKKTGLIRGNILGKRIDFSGRAVIIPEPKLDVDACSLPYFMVLEIMKPHFISYMINRKLYYRYNEASAVVDECLNRKDTKLFPLLKEFVKNKICLLNRQPSLHRMSMLAFKMDVHLGNAIKTHPMSAFPFNFDYDGDAMAVYIPSTPQMEKKMSEKMGIWNNLLSPADGEIIVRPNQDVILGLYTATKD